MCTPEYIEAQRRYNRLIMLYDFVRWCIADGKDPIEEIRNCDKLYEIAKLNIPDWDIKVVGLKEVDVW